MRKDGTYDPNPILQSFAEGFFSHCLFLLFFDSFFLFSKLFSKLIISIFFKGARRHQTQSNYYPMGIGKGNQLGFYIHPSSSLFENDFHVDWVLFYDIIYTSKVIFYLFLFLLLLILFLFNIIHFLI